MPHRIILDFIGGCLTLCLFSVNYLLVFGLLFLRCFPAQARSSKEILEAPVVRFASGKIGIPHFVSGPRPAWDVCDFGILV
jgi:hypothetical protein